MKLFFLFTALVTFTAASGTAHAIPVGTTVFVPSLRIVGEIIKEHPRAAQVTIHEYGYPGINYADGNWRVDLLEVVEETASVTGVDLSNQMTTLKSGSTVSFFRTSRGKSLSIKGRVVAVFEQNSEMENTLAIREIKSGNQLGDHYFIRRLSSVRSSADLFTHPTVLNDSTN